MDEINIFGDIQDPDVVQKFNAIYNQSVPQESAKQILDRIASSNGWNPSDETVLANTTVDEYYELFKNEEGRHLSSFVTKCLKFGQFSNPNEQQKEIAGRATQALQKIASESEINKRRVKKFGVSIENA